MPPIIALFICLAFIGYVFWLEYNSSSDFSAALLIPLIWMFISGSRFISKWIRMAPAQEEAYFEGSPIDAVVFAVLIIWAIIIIARRKVDWESLMIHNKIIIGYFLYCAISISWSDYPFISFKRLIKELGTPLMALIILTDRKPTEAIAVILRRLAILWLPLSIVFFKYFPSMGRAFAPDGRMFATGVSQGKNGLGILCLICGIFFAWKYLIGIRTSKVSNLQDKMIDIILIILTAWLLYLSKSATALACIVFTVSLLFLCRTKAINVVPDRIITVVVVGFPIFFLVDSVFDIRNLIYEILGRDSTLTTRVFIWDFLKDMSSHPIIGSGYQSFWLGDRLTKIWDFTGRTINQAHNGYLEIYLNLGYIGVLLIIALVLSGLINIKKKLRENFSAAILSLCFVLTAVMYNYTEALYYGINNIWLLTLFGVIYIPLVRTDEKDEIALDNEQVIKNYL
jgi:O-antigen ligase